MEENQALVLAAMIVDLAKSESNERCASDMTMVSRSVMGAITVKAKAILAQADPDQARHVIGGGVACTSCGSTEIEGHEVTTGSGSASQEMSCNDCGADWTDQYQLVGYA